MATQQNSIIGEVRGRLIELAGRTTQELGIGRIVGQVLGELYLTDGESSLDDIGNNLGLSKAAVSIGARRLDAAFDLRRLDGVFDPPRQLDAAEENARQTPRRRRGTRTCRDIAATGR